MFQNPIPSHPFQHSPSPEVSPSGAGCGAETSRHQRARARPRPSQESTGRGPADTGAFLPIIPIFMSARIAARGSGAAQQNEAAHAGPGTPLLGALGGPREQLLALRSISSTAQPLRALAACEVLRGANPTASSGEPRCTAALRQDPDLLAWHRGPWLSRAPEPRRAAPCHAPPRASE